MAERQSSEDNSRSKFEFSFTKNTQKSTKISPTEERIHRFDAPKRSGSVSDLFQRAQKEWSPEPVFRPITRQGSIHDIVKKLEEKRVETATTPTEDRNVFSTRKVHTGDVRRNVETFQNAAPRSQSVRNRSIERYEPSFLLTNGRVGETSKKYENLDRGRSTSVKYEKSESSTLKTKRDDRVGQILRSKNPGQMVHTWRAPPSNREVLARPGIEKVTENIEQKAAKTQDLDRKNQPESPVQTSDGRCMFDETFLSSMNPADLPKLYKMVICDSPDGPTISHRRRAVVE